MRARIRSGMAGTAVAAVLAASVSCGDVARQGRAPVLMVIDSLEAASGATPGELSGFLLSDVLTDGSIFNDVAQATLRIVMKDQGTTGTGVQPGALNSVTLHRYRINYRRADGRNTPGVDVPWPVDGAVTATIAGGATVVVSFEIVRHQAKLDPPLKALGGLAGRVFISTLTEVTFFGTDLAGNDVQVTGTINVSFADYADPE